MGKRLYGKKHGGIGITLDHAEELARDRLEAGDSFFGPGVVIELIERVRKLEKKLAIAKRRAS